MTRSTGAFLLSLALLILFPTALKAQTTPGVLLPTGSMSSPRNFFTLTLLQNGKVLAAGGLDASEKSQSSAELYDPSTGNWTATGSMLKPLAAHTATLLPNGKVLVAGGQAAYGFSFTATATAELYDPSTGTWAPTGSMHTPRSGHMATLITGGVLAGKVLVAGGSSQCQGCLPILASAELYDPNTGTWSVTGGMRLARYWVGPVLVSLPDGSALLVGGINGSSSPFVNEAEVFDSATQTWNVTRGKTTVANGAAALLSGGEVLVAGGISDWDFVADAELFDFSTGTWSAAASMSTDSIAPTLTSLANGQALAAGGMSGRDGVCIDNPSAELYDPGTNKWQPAGRMMVARYLHAATLLPNGQVLIAGGRDCGNRDWSSAELFTPGSPGPKPAVHFSNTSWTFSAHPPGERSGTGRLYVTNIGKAILHIAGVQINGGYDSFAVVNNCPATLGINHTCSLDLTFTPTRTGNIKANLQMTDDAPDSPQTLPIQGIGIGPALHLSNYTWHFNPRPVGQTSGPGRVYVTNMGPALLHFSSISIGGPDAADFSIVSTNCGSTLEPYNKTCSVTFQFTPTAVGTRTAVLNFVDDSIPAQQSMTMSGTGTTP